MKHYYLLLFCLSSCLLAAQAPSTINYQGVVRDPGGAPITTLSAIGVKFEIGDGTNTLVHSETQNAVPVNTLGLFSTKIGLSTPLSNTISWQNGPYTLSVSINPGTGFTFMGAQQFASVPYALYAKSSGNSLPVGTRNGQTLRWDSIPGTWVIDNNLTNDGNHVGIGLYPAGLRSRLHVTTNIGADTSVIFGAHGNIQARGAGMRSIVGGNTNAGQNLFNSAIFGGHHAAVNGGSGMAVGNYGFGSSTNGMGVGLIGIGNGGAPTGSATGLYASALGNPGPNRIAAVFDQGYVYFNDSIFVGGNNVIGANVGNVLTLSSTGRAKWAPVPGGITNIATQGPILGGPISNTGTISLAPSGVTAQGYGSANSYPTFTVDQFGRITNASTLALSAGVSTINTSGPILGGPITSVGTISLANSGVVPGAYGAGPNTVPVFTVDTYGRLISAGSYSLAIPSNTLNGDVKGTFLSNTVTALRNVSLSATAPLLNQHLIYNGSAWTPSNVPVSFSGGTLTVGAGSTFIPGTGLWMLNGSSVVTTNTANFVGIGDNNPSTILHTSGSHNGTLINGFSSSPQTSHRIHNDDLTNNNFSSLIFSTKASNNAMYETAKIVGQNVNHTAGSAAGDLVFLTRSPANLNEVMRITSNGNTGIGTNTPTQRLEVNGNVQIPGANEYLYGSAKTRHISIPVNALNSMRNEVYNFYLDTYVFGFDGESAYGFFNNGTAGVDAVATAPVYLPDGAVVTSFWARYYDNDPSYNLSVSLERKSHSTINNETMAVINSSGTGNGPASMLTQTNNSITSATIDNFNYTYYVKFKSKQNASNLGIADIRITYTVTKAD